MDGCSFITHKVLANFRFCKDVEFLYLANLLDEVLLMVFFFQYDHVFHSGNLEHYTNAMICLAIIFIIWECHHYDRSSLSMLSDISPEDQLPLLLQFQEKLAISDNRTESRNPALLTTHPHCNTL